MTSLIRNDFSDDVEHFVILYNALVKQLDSLKKIYNEHKLNEHNLIILNNLVRGSNVYEHSGGDLHRDQTVC